MEACPTRALTMTNEYELADDSRESLIWTKEQLLAPLLPGMEQPPHDMRLGETEEDYYNLRSAGVVADPAWPGAGRRSRGADLDGPARTRPQRRASRAGADETGAQQ